MIARLLDGGRRCSRPAAALSCARRPAIVSGAKAVSIWLKADADIIMRRVKRRADRPLLQTADPAATVERLIAEREPVYQHADLTISSRDVPHEKIVDECIDALHARLCGEPRPPGIGHTERHTMTAPLKHSASITVDVALGDRAYDIVIGRDVLPSLGARIAALRPGARTAIVTDRTVAKHWLEPGPRPRWRRPASRHRMSSSTKAKAPRPMPDLKRSARR